MLELRERGSHGFFKGPGSSIKRKGCVVSGAVADVGSTNISLIQCFCFLGCIPRSGVAGASVVLLVIF